MILLPEKRIQRWWCFKSASSSCPRVLPRVVRLWDGFEACRVRADLDLQHPDDSAMKEAR